VALRGACYVALASLLAMLDAALDGIILVAEPARSLTGRDVVEVLGIPVVATVASQPRRRLHDRRRPPREARAPPPKARPAQSPRRPKRPLGTHTDLPRP
jgi:hypothetical protein